MPHTSKSNQSRAITSPDAQQIASSNQTVNFLLGGRARSWMTGDPSATTNPTRLAPVASSNSRKRNKKRKVSDAAPPTQNDNDIHRDNNPTEQSFEQRPSAGEPARILAEACQNEDFFYIAFHQALCAWSLNRGPIHALFLGLVQPNLLDAAFDVAQTILRKNEHMSHAHLQWFANFPSTIAEFSRVFPNTEAARDISAFLIQLATNWHTLSQNVQARRYPLLASELIFILRCRAKGLQSMLFTMSRRSLGVNDGPVAGAMNVIFDQDREDEAAYEARGEPPETLKRAREAIAMKYRDLVMSAAQRAASNAGSSAHIVAQRGHQSLPPTTTNLSYPVHTASASSPSLPSHFDAFAVRPSVGDPRVCQRDSGPATTESPSHPNRYCNIVASFCHCLPVSPVITASITQVVKRWVAPHTTKPRVSSYD
ncbi:hypothetical protein HZS61_003972 [Fusarium oxysporum f. sp. conglutinans]|uniref:Uncharacterized protein n=1 Tax=Fusarium oxysporum f. sp. conglutinans TaxID=100902 RepID=A0A8H6LE22_FUSOX|nr:hypothetical protein HZS61_003972 [Fusarium oxysporum f. sp. conglutinans]